MAERSSGLTGNQLKILACAAMFGDHAAKALQISGVPYFLLSRVLGRIAFPLFAFLLVEGFLHTKNRARYLFRLLLFALLSEIPFNLVIFKNLLHPEYQNTLWTLLLGLLLLICLERIESVREMRASLSWFLRILLIAGFSFGAWIFHADYSYRGIFCIAVFYLLRSVRPRSIAAFWASIGLNIPAINNPGAFFSMLPLHFYNGERGKLRLKYFFYLFYPLHLLLLLLLQQLNSLPFKM